MKRNGHGVVIRRGWITPKLEIKRILPQDTNEDQKVASQGIFLIGEKKTTAESKILANARKPSAATEKLCRFLRFGIFSGGLVFCPIIPQKTAFV